MTTLLNTNVPLRSPRPRRTAAATVIVPAYNEEAGLVAVLRELAPLRDEGIDVVVVDDGSTDHTALVAEAAGFHVVRREHNGGKGAAIRSGLTSVRTAKVITIDGDATYPVAAILPIVRLLDEYDIVFGARNIGRDNIPLLNRIGNAALRFAIRAVSGCRSADPLTGLYGVRREHLETMALRSDGFGVEAEIAMKAARLGLRQVDHPIGYGERIGQSKLSPIRDGTAIARTVLTLALDGSLTRLSKRRRRRLRPHARS